MFFYIHYIDIALWSKLKSRISYRSFAPALKNLWERHVTFS